MIVRDRDSKFCAEFDRVAKGAGIKVVRTAVRAPLMNARCERFLGSARRECLDHIIILGRRHLECVLRAAKYAQGATIRSLPVLGGLHHDYQMAA